MKRLWHTFIDACEKKKALKSSDLIFPSLRVTWVYRELNHWWKSSIWLLRASPKLLKINPSEILWLQNFFQVLFSTSKIILNCSHQMFRSTVQNKHSRDNSRTANKNYNHTDQNAAPSKDINASPLKTTSFQQVMVPSKSRKNCIKNKHGLWIVMVRSKAGVQAFPVQSQTYTFPACLENSVNLSNTFLISKTKQL